MIRRTRLAPDLEIPRVRTGLWKVADLEKDGTTLDPDTASDGLLAHAEAGNDGFDMADHDGSAELIAARATEKLTARGVSGARFVTKWCPAPGDATEDGIRARIQDRHTRLGTDCIDLLQLHLWSFRHPGWFDVLDHLGTMQSSGTITALGVTNFDADHWLLALAEGH